jgi:hypothetical protein
VWLLVSPILAVVVAMPAALGVGTFIATGLGAEWLGGRGHAFFDRDGE